MSAPHPMFHLFDFAATKGDHVYIGTSLILAGIVPTFFSSATLQTVYFALLIPPAGYHCYSWARKVIWPTVKKWFK
jgi:hypothetical protein